MTDERRGGSTYRLEASFHLVYLFRTQDQAAKACSQPPSDWSGDDRRAYDHLVIEVAPVIDTWYQGDWPNG